MENGQFHVIYGNTKLDRVYCAVCLDESFVIDGKLVCCGKVVELGVRKTVRECAPAPGRRKPSKDDQTRILYNQDYQCFYCCRGLGSLVFLDGKSFRLKTEYDHVIPHSFSSNQHVENFVAACHICNALKSNLMFNSLEEAQVFLLNRWQEKGYYD